MQKPTRTIICDIDGTLTIFFNDVMKHYRNKDYDAFNMACLRLPPRDILIDQIVSRYAADTKIVFMTGRPISLVRQTAEFLAKHFCGCRYELFMRAAGDFRSSVKLKEQWTRGLIRNNHDIVCAYDDRHDICEMYRDEFLITTVQVSLDYFGGNEDGEIK